MSDAEARVPQAITRRQAARLLQAARNAFQQNAENAGERIGWVYSIMRDRRAARRLKIDYLLAIENYDAADALLARCLLQEEEQPLMRLRYARSMLAQGRVRQADREVRRVLVLRPQHGGALVLASQIAGALAQRRRAVALLVLASDERPHNDRLRCLLIQSLLDAGLVERASMVLAERTSPTLISARVLRAQGRVRDAIDLLQRAVENEFGTERDANLYELIDLLELVGDRAQLAELMRKLDHAAPATLLRGAQAMLALGSCFGAATLLRDQAVEPSLRRGWLYTTMVAHAANGNKGQARSAFESLRRVGQAKTSIRLAETWLRGLVARTISEQTDARRASADPHMSLLQPMVRQAIAAFDEALDDSAEVAAVFDQVSLEHHRAICRHALGLPVGASAGLGHLKPLSADDSEPTHDSAPQRVTNPVRRAA